MLTLHIDEKRELLLALDDASKQMNKLVVLKPEWLEKPEVQDYLAEMLSDEQVVYPFNRRNMIQFTSRGSAQSSRLIAAMRRLP